MKKSTMLAIFIITVLANCAFAGDVVHLRNGAKYDGKVLAMQADTLEMSTSEDMPLRFIAIKDIALIVYANGQTVSFQDTLNAAETEKALEEVRARLANTRAVSRWSGCVIGTGCGILLAVGIGLYLLSLVIYK